MPLMYGAQGIRMEFGIGPQLLTTAIYGIEPASFSAYATDTKKSASLYPRTMPVHPWIS